MKVLRALRNTLALSAIYLFLYIPILVLLAFSFNEASFPAAWKGFTLKWYEELFHSSYLWEAFANSLSIAALSTLLALGLGVFLIFYVASGSRIVRFLRLFYGNLVIPEIVLAVGLLGLFSLLSIPLGFSTLVFAHTVLGLGFVIPLLYARFIELDERLMEASLVLGATPRQTFFTVTLPLLGPTLIAAGLLVFITSFDDFILSYFCTMNTQTLSLYILSMLRSGISPVVNALFTLLLLLSSALVFLFFTIKSRARIFT